MGTIADTLQILERVMEYKKAARDVCLAAARQTCGDPADVLTRIAKAHSAHLQEIPRIFKDIQFRGTRSAEEAALTEIDVSLFRDAGKGTSLDLVGAAVRIEAEAMRLLQKPLERSGRGDLRRFLELVIRTAGENIETMKKLGPSAPRAG